MDEKQIAATRARQGRRGRQMAVVLLASLALAALVWFGLGIYGEAIDAQSVDQSGASADKPQ